MKSAITWSLPACAHPPRPNSPRVSSSGRAGACITPSSDRWVMTVSFRMAVFLSRRDLSFPTRTRPARIDIRSGAERLGGFGAGLHDLLQRQAERPGRSEEHTSEL